MPQNKEVISQWSESAPYWEKHREIIREMFAPVTQALIEDTKITGRPLPAAGQSHAVGHPAIWAGAAAADRSRRRGRPCLVPLPETARRARRLHPRINLCDVRRVRFPPEFR